MPGDRGNDSPAPLKYINLAAANSCHRLWAMSVIHNIRRVYFVVPVANEAGSTVIIGWFVFVKSGAL